MTIAPSPHKPTVRDVAAEAGVSVATVSRVLAGAAKPVTKQTRARVLAAVERLGYVTNMTAKSLATGKTGTVGVIVPDLSNQYFTMIVQSIVHAAREDSYQVFVGDSLDATGAEPDLATRILLRSDGLILCSPRSTPDGLAPVLTGAKPVVTVNRRFPDAPAASSVTTDTLEATQAIVDHLQPLGHRGIAFVGASVGSQQNAVRWEAIRARVAEAGGRSWNIPLPLGEETKLAPALRPVIDDGCTAIVAANDLQAAAVCSALTLLEVKVPDDISVVGFDDTPLARWLTPQLTTARMHEPKVGRAAWAAMRALLVDPADVTHVRFTAELVLRDSTAPARQSQPGSPRSS